MTVTWLSSGGKPFPWSVKPPVLVIDWSNPLTQALSFDANYFMPAASANMEGVTGQKSAITGAVPQIGPWGAQRGFAGGSSTDSDMYNLPTSLQNNNNLLSIEALVYLNAYSTGGGFGRLLDKGGATSQLFRIYCEDSTSTINFLANFSGGDSQNSFNLPAGSWQHIVMVYDRSVGTNVPTVYINGAPVTLIHNATTTGTPTPDAASIGIGNRQQQDRAWNGYISHVRTWNRLLSQSEALALYQNPWQIYTSWTPPVPELGAPISATGIVSLSGGGKLPFGAKPDNPVIDETCELAQALVFDANYSSRGGRGNAELANRIIGTYGGTPLPAPVMGPHGSMMLFPGGTGSNSTVDTYTTPARVNGLARMSVEAFFIPFGPGGGSNPGAGRIMQKGSASVSHFQIQWSDTDGTGDITCLVYWNGGAIQAVWSTDTSSAPVGVPCHLVVTYDNSSTSNAPQIWINGVAQNVNVGAAPSGAAPTDDAVLTIGNRDAGDRPVNAAISYVRVYNRILTSQEARALYSNPWQIYRAPPPVLALLGGTPYLLGATRGTINETGEAALLTVARLLPANRGSFSLGGQVATLRRGYTLLAGQGGFIETGQAALFGIKMPAAQGSFALSGESVGLFWTPAGTHSFTLAGAQGSFALAGQLATLKAGRKFNATNGTVSLTGKAANLARGKGVGGGQGIFTLSGKAAGFHVALSIKAQCGTLMLASEIANLKKSGWSAVSPNVTAWTPQIPGSPVWTGPEAEETTWTPN